MAGVEPASLTATGLKPVVSTSSTTPSLNPAYPHGRAGKRNNAKTFLSPHGVMKRNTYSKQTNSHILPVSLHLNLHLPYELRFVTARDVYPRLVA